MTGAPARRLRRAVAAAAMVLLFLAIGEGASRLLLGSGWVLAHLGREDPTVARLRWVRGHGGAHFQYAFDTYDSLRGWAVAPNIAHRAVFGGKWLSSTPRGVRAEADVPYERVPGRRRIVVLGDSYTFGDEVSNDETYAADLGRLLPNTDVVNLGVHGYGHDQMLTYLRTEGVKYRPDVVILGYVWFDQYRNLYAFTNYAKPTYVLRGGRLDITGVPAPPPDRVLAAEPWRPKVLDLARIAVQTVRWRLGLERARATLLTRAILDAFAATARDAGATPVIAYLPVLDELADTAAALDPQEQELQAFCVERGVLCAFLRPVFARQRERGIAYPAHAHWDAAAHLVAAQALAAFLASHGLAATTDSAARPRARAAPRR